MDQKKKTLPVADKAPDIRDWTLCEATAEMLEKAREDGVQTAFDRAAGMRACPIGADSACCKHCAMGPCRLVSKDPYGKVGVCGATIDTIMSRNFARMVACGTAAHSSHGRGMLKLFKAVVEGEIKDYTISDPAKLESVARSVGVETDGRELNDIALDLIAELEKSFTAEGEPPLVQRVPEKTLETWRKLDIVPRGAMLEVMELLQRTHAGMDQDYENLTRQISRTALADGWGGAMVATEISDILFGTPTPVRSEVNMGCLKEDQVNIIIHGHEPNLLESMVESVSDPELIAAAEEAGAKGINLAGMCCTANEILMRHGVGIAGNFLQQELAIVTGAVDAMVVDVQCIFQSIATVAECYHTKIITTSPKAKIPGAIHIEFDEHDALTSARKIVKTAIENFPNRKGNVGIPDNETSQIAGFSHETINYLLGGMFRASYRPLNDNIINGRIRGLAGVVGCNNARVKHNEGHIAMVKELIKNDVLVVTTGCNAIACAEAGLLVPEAAAEFAGEGLREVCETVGIPPVLHMGSCVDNSRILIAATAMVKDGGLGDDISDLPVAGAAPEWMSEKAISIGQYFVASGVYTVFGVNWPTLGSKEVTDFLFKDMEDMYGGMWGFEEDPIKAAHLMIDHIDKKRKALGIDKARERVLYDMEMRRELT